MNAVLIVSGVAATFFAFADTQADSQRKRSGPASGKSNDQRSHPEVSDLQCGADDRTAEGFPGAWETYWKNDHDFAASTPNPEG